MPKVRQEQLPDEILSFLGHELFQIPVRQFMDDNCLLFDKQIPASDDHKKIHAVYRKLVDTLLETFCKDAGITIDDMHEAILNMKSIDAIKEAFQLLFEQIEASVSYDVFYQVMEARNLQIQQQVLAMILTMTGGDLPECMTPSEERRSRRHAAEIAPVRDEQEEKIMEQVMRQSAHDHERQLSRKKSEDKMLQETIELSKQEAERVQQDRREVEAGLHKLALIDEPKKRAASASGQRKAAPEAANYSRAGGSKPPQPKGKSGAEAASDWLSAARVEAADAYVPVSGGAHGNDPDVMKKRADFFKHQREKLLAMKKEEREKMLNRAETDGPKRPCSARAARKAIDRPELSVPSKEDEKKMQMKRAIAEKLRQEVINN